MYVYWLSCVICALYIAVRLVHLSAKTILQGAHSAIAVNEHADLILVGERSSVHDVVEVACSSSFFVYTESAHLVSPYPSFYRPQRGDGIVVHVQHLPHATEEAAERLRLAPVVRPDQQSLALRSAFTSIRTFRTPHIHTYIHTYTMHIEVLLFSHVDISHTCSSFPMES